MRLKNFVKRDIEIPTELNNKLKSISRFEGEEAYHIVSALKAYLRRWEAQHGKIDTARSDNEGA